MQDLITKATKLAMANGALLALVATFVGAFSGTPGALSELLLPMSFLFVGMMTAGLLAGGDIVLNWATRSTSPVELIFARGVAQGIIWTSAAAGATGCVTLILSIRTIASFG